MKKLTTLVLIFSLHICSVELSAGEITVNDDKVIEISSETKFKIDDEEKTQSEFENHNKGLVVSVKSGSTSSAATDVIAENHIKGPVTSLDPFQVFGQDVVIDGATTLVNNNGSFNMDDLLEVSGHLTSNNIFLATRIELKSSLQKWKLIGYVESVTGSDIMMGEVVFNTAGVSLLNCPTPLSTGLIVKIELPSIVDFSVVNPVTNISKFQCKDGLADLSGSSNSDLEFEIEGFVTNVIDSNNFEINGQKIEVSSATIYVNGTQADIIENVKLEAEGTLDSNSNILIADKIKFKNTKVRIKGPVSVDDITSEQITIMEVTGVITALSEDKDNLINSIPSSSINIEARGYVDNSGVFYIEEFRERGTADSNDVRIRSIISDLNQAAFSVMGVNIDTTDAQFFIEDIAVDSIEFYNKLTTSSIVDINHGIYNSETNTISGGEVTIELEDSNSVSTKLKSLVAAVNSLTYGTVTNFKSTASTPTPTIDPTVNTASASGSGSTNSIILLLLSLGIFVRKLK